jgi:hypothetical protein
MGLVLKYTKVDAQNDIYVNANSLKSKLFTGYKFSDNLI